MNWGDTIHIRFAEANFGDATAGAHKIGIFVSPDANIDPATDVRIFTYNVGSVASNSGVSINYGTITLPSSNPLPGAPTTVYFGMVVDVDGQVTEGDETNNRNLGDSIDRDDTPLTITPPVPDIVSTDSVPPNNDNSINFGSVANDGTGQSRGVQTLTVINKGKANLNVTGITLTGSSAFSLVEIASSTQSFIATSSLPRVIAKNGGESWVFTLQFDPAANGAATGTLNITTNDPDTPVLAIALSGTGSPIPDIALTTAAAVETDFGGVLMDGAGGVSATRTITFKNVGSGPLTVSQNGVSLLTGPQFSVVSVTSSTQGVLNLATGARTMAAATETWDVVVRFDPTALGSFTDGLRVLSDDPDEATFTVSLRGQGLNPMKLDVTDSSGSPTDKSIAYPGTHADGVGLVTSSATVTLKNSGEAPLTVSQNGITFATGTHFKLSSVTSDVAGAIDLTTAAKQIAPGNAETWTLTVLFDPTVAGVLTDTLRIASNDPTLALTTVALSGTGLNEPDLSITDSVTPANDLALNFGPVLNDGAGNVEVLQTVTLKNLGAQPLIVGQNGLVRTGSTAFRIVSVVSSTDGPVDVSSASAAVRTISPAQAETWTVTLGFDPTADGPASATLGVASNDPQTPSVSVALSGTGSSPSITMLQPSVSLNVSAGSTIPLTWQDSYAAGNATIALYLDADTNPAVGLIQIASGLSEDDAANSFTWRVDPARVGGTWHVYATITAGGVTRGSYAPGVLIVNQAGSFLLRSSQEVTSADYAYEFERDGQIFTGTTTLTAGLNTVDIPATLPDGTVSINRFNVTLVPSLTHRETLQHDTLNRVQQVTNGNGITTTLTYDPLGRLVSRQSSNGALVTFGYNVLNLRTSMTDSTGTTFYEYDELKRLTAVITSKNATKGDSDDLRLGYEYDLAGRRTAVIYPGGERVEYLYDNAGRMATVTNVTRNLVFNYTYHPTTGQLTKLTRPNGIETLYSYDGMGRLTTNRHQKTAGAVLVQEFFYTLDAAGKATEVRVTLPGNVIRREGYSYDRFDRLTQVIYADDGTIDANDRTQIWTYDGNGNRLTQTTKVNNVVTEVRNYTYGNENRLLKVADQNGVTVAEYRYDSAGNRIQKITPNKTTNYSYDERNLMVSYNDGTSFVTFEYDGNGQRVASTLNGARKVFVNDPSLAYYDAVQERDSSGTIASATTFGASRLVSGGAQTKFELDDRIGSAQVLTDGAGATLASMRYDAFGAEASSNPAARFAGTVAELDARFYFMRARLYDFETGAFISKDPLGIADSFNTYNYAGTNPVNFVDPSGTYAVLDDLAFAYGGGLLGVLQQGASDLVSLAVNGKVSSGFADYQGAFVGGVAQGLGTLYAGPLAGAVLGSEVKQIQTAYLKGEQLSTEQFAFKIGGDLVGQIITGGIKVPINGVTSGQGSWAAVSKGLITKLENETISNISATSAGKIFGNEVISGLTKLPFDVGIGKITDAVSFGDIGSSSGGSSFSSSLDFTLRGDHLLGLSDQRFDVVPFLPPGGGGGAAFNVGGVLLDKAATLVGSNLSDLRGAVYDPVTGQFVFLGTDGGAAVKDINLDYLYTALQAVYGSAVPPFVTLDPPATAYTQWTDFGNGNGAFDATEKGGFTVRYSPIWWEVDTTVDIAIHTGNGDWVARFDCLPENIYSGDRRAMKMVFNSWVTAPPSGVTLDTTPWQWHIFSQTSFRLGPDGQDSFTRFTLTNGSASTYVVNGVEVLPARHHRKYGGRVESSRLGWVMLEADRIMKCLSVGKDNLTSAPYNSGTIAIAGYKNIGEIAIANGGTSGGNIRMWFTPNEMTLKRHLDPVTGRASIVFDQGSVKLNTESFILGLPQPPEARTFADFLTANYDAFAALSFPCVDPADPTGMNIIQVKIFDQLRDVMRAVSLARFFRDNAVPVDTWWLNSWQVPVSYSPKSTPAVTNIVSGGNVSIVMYGGVQVAKPNAYVPSASAKSVADVVQSSHPDVTGKPNGDLKEQVWSASTVEGGLKAVAASTKAEPQDGAINLAEVDLSFPSPGALPLQFVRYYQSSYLGRYCMGPGWRFTPFVIEFERPSWYDENGLMKNAGTAVYSDSQKNTRLRSGAVRVVDLRTGGVLDFQSSLQLGYDVSNTGNVVITLAGLDASGLPTFTPGQRQGGATLAQFVDAAQERKYKLTSPDGAELTFDYEGRLLQTKDRNGKTQTYTWDAQGCLTTLADQAGQTLTMAYDAVTKKLLSVTGPHSEAVNYTYTPEGCLLRATHVRSTAFVEYRYTANCQLDKKTRFNGLKAFESAPDLKGRAETASDVRGNAANSTFTQDSVGSVRTTQTADPLVTDAAFMPAREQFARDGRLLASRSVTGPETTLAYDAGSLAPNQVTLPIAGRPTIRIDRNSYGQPTRISDPGNTGAQDITAAYDPTTKLPIQMTDAAGRPTDLLYDGSKNVRCVRRHLGGQNVDVDFGYTANGALNSIKNPLGITAVTINRDSVDRVTSVVDATGVTLSYIYDTLGRLWKITDPRLSSQVVYVYDNYDRVIQIQFPAGSIFYSYDPVKGWLTGMTDLLGRVTSYTRDPNTGDILQVVDVVAGGTNRITGLSYNRFGNIAGVTPPGAAPINFTFDQIGRSTGSTETDIVAPGAPKALRSNNATDNVPTTLRNHTFTWGAPDSDNGIAGYSYSFDQAPDNTVDVIVAPAIWSNASIGTHTFQVKAKSNNGLWGQPAVFHLVVSSLAGYELWRSQQFTPTEVLNESISGPAADAEGDGFRNLIEYAINSAPKVPTAPGVAAVFAGNELSLSFNRNPNATDVTLVIEASTNLGFGPWMPIAQKVGGAPWTVDYGILVSDSDSGPVTVTDAFSTAQGAQRYLRLKVLKP